MLTHGPGAIHSQKESVVRNDYVTVTVLCPCNREWRLCVPVSLAVPRSLRCSPNGSPIRAPGVVRSDICCPRCRCTLFADHSALVERVESELRRGRGTHVQAGSVIIDCR